MARRLGCEGAWENAPRTVSIPAATSTRNRKPALRFSTDMLLLPIVSSVLPAPLARPARKGASVFRAWSGCKRTHQGEAMFARAGDFFGVSLRGATPEPSAIIFSVLDLLIGQLRS